jgi:hypothetical protein
MTHESEEPSADDAEQIALRYRVDAPASVRRFPMGLAHWVYEVRFADGASIVVRLTKSEYRQAFVGALHWSKMLRPLGVPLPEVLEHGEHRGLPYLVLERLAGDDLGVVYEQLTSAERDGIAREMCRVQQLVAMLPEGEGYGSATLPTGPFMPTWRAYLDDMLSLCRSRIEAAGVVSPHVVDRVADAAASLDGYFASIRATPFLDDATTKNVLVHEGRLNGIVDVDELGFGDPLLTIGLTRASLLAANRDCEYTDSWSNALALNAEQRRAVSFYTALFCVVFMSEQGQRFNRGVERADEVLIARLARLLEIALAECLAHCLL